MKIVLEGCYGVKNLGDDYLLCSILQTLSKTKENLNISIICSGEETEEIVKLFPDIKIKVINQAIGKGLLHRAVRKIRTISAFVRCDMYIFGGGGLFPVDKPIYYANLYRKLLKAKKLGTKKLSIYGIDICGIKDDESKNVWGKIVDITDYLNFRNRYSAELINACVEDKNATYAPDISFSYVSEYEKNQRKLDDLLNVLGLEKEKYIVWVLAMPWTDEELKQENIKERYKKLVGQISKVCNRYSLSGYKNVFLPFYHDSDCKLIHDVQRHLEGQYLVLEEHQILLGAKRALFKDARACVSMRFHGIAFSLYHGIPVGAISYAPKSSQIMSENGLGEYCTEFGIRAVSCFFREFDIDEEQLIKICDKAIVENYRELFEKVSVELRNAAADNESRLLALLK